MTGLDPGPAGPSTWQPDPFHGRAGRGATPWQPRPTGRLCTRRGWIQAPHGLPSDSSIRSTVGRDFPELHDRLRLPKAAGWPKRQILAEEVYEARFIVECRPAGVVFPRLTGAVCSALEPMDRAEALLELVPNVLLTEARSSQAHLDAVAKLARTCACYRLDTGRDFDALPGLLRGLVAESGQMDQSTRVLLACLALRDGQAAPPELAQAPAPAWEAVAEKASDYDREIFPVPRCRAHLVYYPVRMAGLLRRDLPRAWRLLRRDEKMVAWAEREEARTGLWQWLAPTQ